MIEPTPAEQRVLTAFQAGDPDVNVARAKIRGDFLRGLILGEYDSQADYRGTCIVGASVLDVLDMEFCETKFPIRFHNCSFVREIKLRQLTCPELDFRGCSLIGNFDAQMAKVSGSVNLTRVVSVAPVSFANAEIGGQLVCTGARFQNKEGYAFHAPDVKVTADVFLRDGFIAVGEVNLAGADIGRQLVCTGGNFWNDGGNAINAQSIKVSGALLNTDSSGSQNIIEFRAIGTVWLSGADIRGQLDCGGGNFHHKGKAALNAECIKTTGSVVLSRGFNAEGAVTLAGAEIRGQLDCGGGNFQNQDGPALNVQGIKVASDVFLIPHANAQREERFAATGLVSFINATIGGSFFLEGCKLARLSLAGTNVLGEFQDDADAYKLDKGDDIDLNIDGFRYQRLGDVKERAKARLEWVGLMSGGGDFYPQPYEQLMKVYREMGHMNLARKVGLELERKRHKQLRLNRDHKRFVVLGWAWWFWYWILRGTIGYGYKPFRAVTRWLAPLILAGFVLFSGTLPLSCPDPCRAGSEACHCMAPSDAEVLLSDDWKIHGKLPKDYPDFNPFYYAVETALPVLPLGQTQNWHPKTWWAKWLQGAITIIGALVLTILASFGVGVLGPRWKNE